MSSPIESSPIESLAAADRAPAVDALLATLDGPLGDAELQAVMGAAVKRYAERLGEGGELRAFAPGAGVTATEAMLVTTAILRAVNVQLFELGMWQAWSGGR